MEKSLSSVINHILNKYCNTSSIQQHKISILCVRRLAFFSSFQTMKSERFYCYQIRKIFMFHLGLKGNMVAINVIFIIGSTLWHNTPNITTIIFVIIYVLSSHLATVIWLSYIILVSSRKERFFILKAKQYIFICNYIYFFMKHYLYATVFYNPTTDGSFMSSNRIF